MGRHVYASKYGGQVHAVLAERDPALELQVIQGHLHVHEEADSHPLCCHVDAPNEPTTLDGWQHHHDGHPEHDLGLHYHAPGSQNGGGGGSPATASPQDVAALSRKVDELTRALKSRGKSAGGEG